MKEEHRRLDRVKVETRGESWAKVGGKGDDRQGTRGGGKEEASSKEVQSVLEDRAIGH